MSSFAQHLEEALKTPVIESANNLAEQVCRAEIKKQREIHINSDNTDKTRIAFSESAITITTLEKYGQGEIGTFEALDNPVPETDKPIEQLALELAIARARDKILDERRNPPQPQYLKSLFGLLSNRQSPPPEENYTRNALHRDLKQYKINLAPENFNRVLKHAYLSADEMYLPQMNRTYAKYMGISND
ncbi:MAG: hypothetical protein IT559_08865 [Alphaproteobacteria bacterium]|nr:hypothetical protein [Alphaproteobacteria bacterium]